MKKIPTMFKRNPQNRQELLNEPHPDCYWVFQGEGVATRKYDGTCVMIQDGQYYKRREISPGKEIPEGFMETEYDSTTGKRVGWIKVDPEAKENKWHMEAFDSALPDGTYELVGPKVQGNPEQHEKHMLISHAKAQQFLDAPRTFEGLRDWLHNKNIEGVVFHHPDGRMAKIKKRDFGFKRANL